MKLRRVIALSIVAAGMSAAVASFAQTGSDSGPVSQSPEEQEAYDLLGQEKLIGARTSAEKALARDRHSIVGHYVLGVVLHRAEGSHPRAMYHLGRARELYEQRYGTTRSATAPWMLHREILFAIQGLAGEMEMYEYQLDMIGWHDYLYDPDLIGERAWPMMQLGRYDEARDYATRATKSRDGWQQALGTNALCAIEGEARERTKAWEACKLAFDKASERAAGANPAETDDSQHVAVHAYNAALAALGAVKIDEAEELLVEGARRFEFTTANPWRQLAMLYTRQGRMEDAVGALREMHRWRVRLPAYLRDQDRAETDSVFATVLLAAGEDEVALRAITRALDQPDRRGLTTSRPEQALGAHALIRRAVQRLRAERIREETAAFGALDAIGGRFRAAGVRAESWPDDERIASALSDDDRIDSTLRLFVHGGIEPVPLWLLGDLVPVMGGGVFEVALRHARRDSAALPALAPYYDALEADVAMQRGDEDRAWQKAKAALDALPLSEGLLRARTAAVAAQAAEDRGRTSDALGMYEMVMQSDAGTIRRLGLSIPARVEARGGGAVQRAADAIERSPRLREAGRGFTVIVELVGENLQACMRSVHGAQLGCATAPLVVPEAPAREPPPEQGRDGAQKQPPRQGEAAEEEEEEEPDPPEIRLARAFHRDVFGSALALSTTDLGSLDGRVSASAEATRDQMRDALRDVIETQGQMP